MPEVRLEERREMTEVNKQGQETNPFAKSFRDLIVYQKSRSLAFDIYIISKTFPREETYSLTDQIRRSSRSVGAQIAEAWAKKRYMKHFISKLSDADGEQLETQHWIGVAVDCGYIERNKAEILKTKCLEIGCMLGSMIGNPEGFCNGSKKEIHETHGQYFVNSLGENLELSIPDQEESSMFGSLTSDF